MSIWRRLWSEEEADLARRVLATPEDALFRVEWFLAWLGSNGQRKNPGSLLIRCRARVAANAKQPPIRRDKLVLIRAATIVYRAPSEPPLNTTFMNVEQPNRHHTYRQRWTTTTEMERSLLVRRLTLSRWACLSSVCVILWLQGSWPCLQLLLSVDCGVPHGGEVSRLSELFGQVVGLQGLIGSDEHMPL